MSKRGRKPARQAAFTPVTAPPRRGNVTLTAWIRGSFHFLHFVTLRQAQGGPSRSSGGASKVTKWARSKVTSRVTRAPRDRVGSRGCGAWAVRIIREDRPQRERCRKEVCA